MGVAVAIVQRDGQMDIASSRLVSLRDCGHEEARFEYGAVGNQARVRNWIGRGRGAVGCYSC